MPKVTVQIDMDDDAVIEAVAEFLLAISERTACDGNAAAATPATTARRQAKRPRQPGEGKPGGR